LVGSGSPWCLWVEGLVEVRSVVQSAFEVEELRVVQLAVLPLALVRG
jgi:hypothetical protein